MRNKKKIKTLENKIDITEPLMKLENGEKEKRLDHNLNNRLKG